MPPADYDKFALGHVRVLRLVLRTQPRSGGKITPALDTGFGSWYQSPRTK